MEPYAYAYAYAYAYDYSHAYAYVYFAACVPSTPVNDNPGCASVCAYARAAQVFFGVQTACGGLQQDVHIYPRLQLRERLNERANNQSARRRTS